MDINSLLSPQDSPATDEQPTRGVGAGGGPGSIRRTHSSSLTPTSVPTPPVISPGLAMSSLSARGTPPVNGSATAVRQNSITTVGMDTLADLASMQHPQKQQQSARATATGLRSTELIDPRQLPASISLTPLPAIPHTAGTPRGSIDLAMADAPPLEQALPRTYTASSLSESDLATVAELFESLAANPHAYDSHVKLINLLHQGFCAHVYPPSTGDASTQEPSTYELLPELRQARRAMDQRVAVGEELWLDWISDEGLLAHTLEEKVAVMELCKRAVEDETGSTKLWLLYGDWINSLYKAAHFGHQGSSNTPAFSGANTWTDEERELGKELFSWEIMLDVWKQGVRATRWKINDSNLIWDRYTELLMEDLARAPTKAKVDYLRAAFTDRLQVPHATWDQTFQAFSTFTTTYDNAAYEEIMVKTNVLSARAKEKYAMREVFENNLKRAVESKGTTAEWNAYAEYLEWETGQSRKQIDLLLCSALYERLLSRFGAQASLWEEYVYFILEKRVDIGPNAISMLSILKRATRHCPWSGSLWSQHLLSLESAGKPFEEVEAVKHEATQKGLFEVGGWEEVMQVYIAWSGFLKRRAFLEKATDEDLDVAEVGIRSALEGVEQLGLRKYGKDYHGDPRFRLESIYVQYLSEKGSWDEARNVWMELVAQRGNSHTFWLSYYSWEMLRWCRLSGVQSAVGPNGAKQLPPPSHATGVLQQAVKRPDVDWPEKVQEVLLEHAQVYDDAKEMQEAILLVRKMKKVIAKKREKQALETAASAAPQEPQAPISAGATAMEESPAGSKRKRDVDVDAGDAGTAKKSRQNDPVNLGSSKEDQKPSAASLLKRDRENTTVIVKNLPSTVTELKVRQYFRDCGTINSLKILPDNNGESATATIEFDSVEDVLTAQTRNMKTFDGNAIEVQVGTGTTLYVTNYPPTADEAYIRDLFKEYGEIVDIRFPSLKFNTHRRFCYVQFKSPSQARNATALEGKALGEKETLIARISDPNHKEGRKGPVHEGREIYIANLDWSVTEKELSQLFSKYGTVERSRIPRKINGDSRGMGFVVFSSKDEANAALDMHLTKYKTRLLNVSLSEANPAKRHATTIITTTDPTSDQQNGKRSPSSSSRPSPTPDASSPPSQSSRPTPSMIKEKTIGVMNVPDTVNDARITQIFSAHGTLRKVILRPDHQGAIVEFENVADAGRAALALEGMEIAPGRRLQIGTVEEMMREKGEHRDSKLVPAGMMQKPVKRPTQQSGTGRGGPGGKRRGGLGFRAGTRGEGGSSASKEADEKSNGKDEDDNVETGKPKSNADFKAMFLKQ